MALDSPSTAFIAGCLTSLHCVGMCGPLACAILPAKSDDASAAKAAYHAVRVGTYGVLGALAGSLGALPLQMIPEGMRTTLPWLLVLLFLAIALRADRWWPAQSWLGRVHGMAASRVRRWPKPLTAAGLGLVTPLLPCGPLYLVLTTAAFTGSAARGAEFMVAFGVGTVPLLWLAQSRWAWLQGRLSACWLERIRISLALVTAAILAWRLRSTLGLGGPSVDQFLCH